MKLSPDDDANDSNASGESSAMDMPSPSAIASLRNSFGDSFRDGMTRQWHLWRDAPVERPMLIVLAAMIAGLCIDHWFHVASWFAIVLLAVCFLVGLSFRVRRFHRIGWLVIIGAAAAIAMIRGHIEQQQLRENPLAQLAPARWQPFIFEGTIDSVAKLRPDSNGFGHGETAEGEIAWQTIFNIDVTRVRDGPTWKATYGETRFTANADLRDYLPGDSVRVYGHWSAMTAPSNPGQFDAAEHYARLGINLKSRVDSAAQIERIAGTNYWRMDRYLGWLAAQGNTAIERYVGNQQAPLAAALVLGQREQVEYELNESLLATGTIHMLAISGLHVEMVALTVIYGSLFFALPRRFMLLSTATVVIGYAILCGGNPPVMRAMILVVSLCLARWFYRFVDSFNLLATAGILLLMMRSGSLFGIGTQLSFLAVFMLMLAGSYDGQHFNRRDPMDDAIDSTRSKWWLFLRSRPMVFLQWLRISGWVWLITAPLILVNFHVVSPIAIVLNLLLWPFLLVALLSGLGVLLLGTWLPPLGMVFGGICTGALASMQWMIDVAVDVPGGHVWLASPGGWWLIVFYGCFAVFCLFVGLGPQRKRVLALLLLILFLAGLTPGLFGPRGKYPLLASPDDGGLSVTFVDVGHGTSVIIELPDGKTVLYDAGRMGSGERSHLAIAEALWHADVGRVHTAFLSHADADHFNGLAGIAKRFPIETLATTQSVVDKSNSELSAALDAVTDTGAGLRLWTKGDRQQIGGVNFTALHPADDSMAVGDNALSLCLLIEFAGRRIFLPGDLESLGMTELLLGSPVDVDILMAAHHGSLAESPFPLLQWCQPEWIAVSGGKRTAQLRVVHAFEQTGGEVLTTYEYGAVRFEIERGGRLMVKHWAGEDWENVTQGGKFNASGSGVELAF